MHSNNFSFVEAIGKYHFGVFPMGYASFTRSYTSKKRLLSTMAKGVLLFYEDEHGIIILTNHYLRGVNI